MSKIERLGPPALRRLTVHRYAGLFPALVGDERDRLRESLQRDGFDRDRPIIVTPDGAIIDGRNRRDVCCEVGVEVDAFVLVREFADDAEIAAYIRSANLARRHLSARQQRELAGRLVAVDGVSTRDAGRLAGVSQSTAGRAAREARAQVSHADSPAAKSRTNGADGKSYPATRAAATPKKSTSASVSRPTYESSQALAAAEFWVAAFNEGDFMNVLAHNLNEAAADDAWLEWAIALVTQGRDQFDRLHRVITDPVYRRECAGGFDRAVRTRTSDTPQLAKYRKRAQKRTGRHASATADSIIGRAATA